MQQVTISVVSGHQLVITEPQVSEAQYGQIIDYWTDRIARITPDRPDLIVLPELFDRPIMAAHPAAHALPVEARLEFARTKGTRIRDALAEVAAQHQSYLTYPSYRVDDHGRLFNSLEILGRDGSVVAQYDKIVPTLNEQAAMGVNPGSAVLAADLDFGRVSGAICFDLNFEQVRAAVAEAKPQLILFPSAYHGGLMQNYWALSCRAYFVGCVLPPNRSTIINPTGHEVASTSTYDWLITRTVNLDYALVHLGRNREKLRQLKAVHGTRVMIEDPGLVGMVLVSSLSESQTADDMIREFDIQHLDGYFSESTAHLDGTKIEVPRSPGRMLKSQT